MARYNVPHATYEQFKNAVNGRWYDLDGYYGAQCWDGIQLLYTQPDIGQNFVLGNGRAKGAWQNTWCRNINGSGHFRKIEDKRQLKKGDIMVFNTYSGWYGSTGHVGYANEDYNGTNYISMLSQNYGTGSNPTTGKAFNIMNAYLEPFLGAFRYEAWEEEPPTPTPTPSTDWKDEDFPWPVAWEHWGWN